MACRICYEPCYSPTTCACKAFVHPECLHTWQRISGRSVCEVCNSPYVSKRRSVQNTPYVIFLMCVINICYIVGLIVTTRWFVMTGCMFAVQCAVVIFLRNYKDVLPFAIVWKWTSLILLSCIYLSIRGMFVAFQKLLNTSFVKLPAEYTDSVICDSLVTGCLSTFYALFYVWRRGMKHTVG